MAVMATAFDPSYGEAWTRRQVEDALLTGNCSYFLVSSRGKCAKEGEPAAGFFLSRLILDDVELLLLAVDPDFRRRGLGKILLDELAEASKGRSARRIFLEMRRGNPAEKLYRDFGFATVGKRPGYYKSNDGQRVDAITFAFPIKKY